MSFHVKKSGDSFKIKYGSGQSRVLNINKLPNKTNLQTLDIIYLGEPFVNTVSRFQDTRNLDIIYLGIPFYGHTNGYSINRSI